MIELMDLSYSYRPEESVLRRVTMKLEPGTTLAITGQPGSGKTTLIQHLGGLLLPTAGQILLDGATVTSRNRDQLRRRVGIVFQSSEEQFFADTVFEEIAFGLTGHELSRDEIDRQVRSTLKEVGLRDELLEKSPFQLSGGEKRRVAIAGVLASRPEILVLDDPGVGLDPQGRREILDFAAGLQRRSGVTLVLVSQQLDEIIRLTERLIVLKDGAVIYEGMSREILQHLDLLEEAALSVPQITAFMMSLKREIPELRNDIVTVAEARDELQRHLSVTVKRRGMG